MKQYRIDIASEGSIDWTFDEDWYSDLGQAIKEVEREKLEDADLNRIRRYRIWEGKERIVVQG